MSSGPIVLSARLEGGQFRVNRDKLRDLLRGRKDGDYTITIERRHATRSAAQNAWYWGVIMPAIADYTGYTIDEVHEFCKKRFNAKQLTVADRHGVIVEEERIGQSTTTLNKVTFGEYCERIRMWAAAELAIDIPDPDVNWRHQKDESSAELAGASR